MSLSPSAPFSAHVPPEALLPAPSTPIECAKRAAARAAVDAYVRSGMAVGVGSGSTIVYAIQRLAELAHGVAGFKLRCVPTSFQSRQVRRCGHRAPRARISPAPPTPHPAPHSYATLQASWSLTCRPRAPALM